MRELFCCPLQFGLFVALHLSQIHAIQPSDTCSYEWLGEFAKITGISVSNAVSLK
jgi:hypothetical protein